MSPLIKNFTTAEIRNEIKCLNEKKAPGYDLINAKILSELPNQGIQFLRNLLNAILRLKVWPAQMKFAQIIIIPKPGKPPHEVASYRPISLLPQISKLLEKLLIKRMYINNILDDLFPNHQFGFRRRHSTIQQCHRVISVINEALVLKEYCPTVFLDIQQAFDKVWHKGLLYKMKLQLPSEYYLLLKSYLSHRYFQIKHGQAYSDIYAIKSGVPQGSVLGPLLYLLYTSDIPTTPETNIGTFADDTVIMSKHNVPQIATSKLQDHLELIQTWLQKWRIKVNETKSTYVTYMLRRSECPPEP